MYGQNVMQISLDTNVWIFGIVSADEFCEKILFNLAKFEIIIPDQVRVELERNLSTQDLKQFYQLILQAGVRIDSEKVPSTYITEFEQKGLKKGDAEIGAFCEWRKIDVFVSDNRDFLKALPSDQHFQVMSPKMFCETFDL
jgi:predicted nucleic acid-binding protein